MDKLKAYHSNILDTNEDYVLLLENGEEARFIPGSCPKEFFSLKRYKEDLGKDYAKIVLYLCCVSDFLINTDNEEEEKEEKVLCHERSTPKRRKTEATVKFEEVDTQESDEALAKELQKKFDEKNNITNENGVLEAEKNQAMDVSPAGVLGWLTGQKHRPVNGEQLTITAHFDHNCRERNPKHTICFPQVGASSREITFPVAHITDSNEFEHVFLLALCKGGAFSKA